MADDDFEELEEPNPSNQESYFDIVPGTATGLEANEREVMSESSEAAAATGLTHTRRGR